MNKVKKYLLVLLSLFLAFIAGWFVLFRTIQNPSTIHQSYENQEAKETEQEIEIKLIFDENNELTSSYLPWKDKVTAYSLLTKLIEENNLEIETEQYDFGIFIKSIDGKENSNDMAWIYFVNGESGQVAADNMVVKPGDVVEWKYTEPKF